MARKSRKKNLKKIETLTHDEAKRTNIPTAEYQSLAQKNLGQASVTYKRSNETLKEEKETRNRDQDPQLVWRGKDQLDWSDLVVSAPPLYIQEKVHPKVLIDDLCNRSIKNGKENEQQIDLFANFNGLSEECKKTEFYQHDAHWTNRMILGDSLQVMASLAEREGLKGKVQCIYIDPPYGIKFNSNFQWSTNSRDVTDGKLDHITREPEQVKAFRDTWKDGLHSYLTHLRDRLTVARELLHESGSIFVQIGDENLHCIKSLLDEVFGRENYVNTIAVKKKGSTLVTESVFDFIVWFARNRDTLKVRRLLQLRKTPEEDAKFNTLISPHGEMVRIQKLNNAEREELLDANWRWARVNYPIVSQHPHEIRSRDYIYRSEAKKCGANRQWSFDNPAGLDRLNLASRLFDAGGASIAGIVFHDDRPAVALSNLWDDVKGEEGAVYVVQTAWKVVQRCILMASDPGDLVLDPTCGSGTTAYISEQWGRRWITIDSSRVALALARSRIMGARYPYYLLKDSEAGQLKEATISSTVLSTASTYGDIRQGFVYERVPHVTLKAIANNAEIDVIGDRFRLKLEAARTQINKILGKNFQDWEVPFEADKKWTDKALAAHKNWWKLRMDMQNEIDESVAARAEFEYLYDKPYEDKTKVRVSGPFTVESLSPHRSLGVDENDKLIDGLMGSSDSYHEPQIFVQMILENLKISGIQQTHKEDKINFDSVALWPGEMICAEGQFSEGKDKGSNLKRAAIFVGPEFGTVSRPDLVAAAREAADAGFDVLVACAFNYDAHSTEFDSLGRLPVLKARMNADLHMAEDLKNTGKGNLFVIFGEPDIDLLEIGDDKIQVKINGVDVFHPNSETLRSDGADGIACWFVDTDYNEESFFVRQAYFLGANDPYKSLKTTLNAEIDEDAWATLNSDISRPFTKPTSGKIAVKVINHLGDEVMKVYAIE